MEKIQVDILQLCLLQTLVDTSLRVFIVDALRWNLGSVEELFSWDTSTKQALSRGPLVTVSMCRVNMAVARLDSVAYDILCHVRWASNCVSMLG
jgi:hypothetical protein